MLDKASGGCKVSLDNDDRSTHTLFDVAGFSAAAGGPVSRMAGDTQHDLDVD